MNVYDFDGTIYDGDSTADFWKFCLKRNPLPALRSLIPMTVGFVLYMFGIYSKTQLKQRFFAFLRYIPDIDKAVDVFWAAHEKNIKPWYMAQKREDDLIISASPEFLLEPVCERLQVKLIASPVDKHTGVYSGENCSEDEKVRRFRLVFPEASINEFYSDSHNDDPLAGIAAAAYWVDGDVIIPWSGQKPGPTGKIKATFFTRQFFIFLFCGGTATLINFFAALLLSGIMDSTLAYVLGYFFAIFFNYTLNTYLTFKMPFSLLRFGKFIISYIPNFLILTVTVSVMLNVFNLPELVVYLAAAIIAIPLTFVILKFFAFRKKTNVAKMASDRLRTGQLVAGELLPKVDNEQQKELLELVCGMANKRRAGELAEPARLEQAGGFISSNSMYMTSEFLDCIEQIAIVSGLFLLAYTVRKENEKLVLERMQGRKFLSRQEKAKLFWSRVNDGLAPFAVPSAVTRKDALFAEYIKGKRIAIVGPSSSGADYSDEIRRDFDIIVRMKYRGRDTLPQAQRDLVPQITYFRDRKGPWDEKMATSDGKVDYLKDLEYAVLIKEDAQTRKRLQAYTNARVAKLQSNFFFSPAKYNLLQAILQDLLCFEPARIKVFYANLYLSSTRHDEGYKPATYSRGTLDFWYDYAKHNLISQYDYVRQLYLCKLLDADPRLTEILELGTEEYIRQTQEQEDCKKID